MNKHAPVIFHPKKPRSYNAWIIMVDQISGPVTAEIRNVFGNPFVFENRTCLPMKGLILYIFIYVRMKFYFTY